MQAGVGIEWRHPHYQQALQKLPALDFLEFHSENFFAGGGASLAVLERARESYPLSLHGVGLSLGSAIGIDLWHLGRFSALGLSVVNLVAVLSLWEITPAALQQHITWGVLPATLALLGSGHWAADTVWGLFARQSGARSRS